MGLMKRIMSNGRLRGRRLVVEDSALMWRRVLRLRIPIISAHRTDEEVVDVDGNLVVNVSSPVLVRLPCSELRASVFAVPDTR